MMKLRIRSLETRETLKIEVPLQCSIQQLRQMLSGALSSSSSNSSPPPPDSIRLSLNKADEIQSSSPDEDTLQSLGITSGDLIFYTVKINPNPSAVPSETPIPDSQLRIPVPALSSGFKLGYEDPRPFSTPDQNSEIDQKPLRDHTLMESLNPKVAEPNLPCHQDHQSEGMKRDTDLREKVGFEPCFMRLPTDLKLKILELLPGVDVTEISRVSSELRNLASSAGLWEQKFVEQFGDTSKLYEEGPWKKKFARVFKSPRIVRWFDPPPRRDPTHGGGPLWSGCRSLGSV